MTSPPPSPTRRVLGRSSTGCRTACSASNVDTINGAKSDDTRARRIAKSVDLFLAGKPR